MLTRKHEIKALPMGELPTKSGERACGKYPLCRLTAPPPPKGEALLSVIYSPTNYNLNVSIWSGNMVVSWHIVVA